MALSNNLAGALRAVGEERAYQDGKWGAVAEHPHEVGAWLLVMEKCLNDAKLAWAGSRGDTGALHGIRKVIAVGLACAEQHGLPSREVR